MEDEARDIAVRCAETIGSYNKVACIVSFDIWHRRLGHMSDGKMKLLSTVSSLSNKDKDFICDECPKAKQPRLLSPISYISTTYCFELIHVDT